MTITLKFKLALLLFLLSCFQTISFAAISVTDITGQVITLNQPAKKIIALSPSLTEILFAIGAGKNIVGVSSFSDYPAAAKKIPVIANAAEINLEAVLEKHADLIVAWQGGNPAGQLQKLKQLHIPVYFFADKNFAAIAKTMRDLGVLTGHRLQAEQAAAKFSASIKALQNKYQNAKKAKVSVFYQVWQQPLMTVGQASIINKAITLCGGKNIFGNTYGYAPQISVEAVLAANPQLIITGAKNNHWKNYWQRYPELQAVKSHHLFSINPDLLVRSGPRLVLGIQQLCYIINII